MTHIGGPLNLDALTHKPDLRDRHAYRREAHRLAGNGLAVPDIARALHLTDGAVRGLLNEVEPLFAPHKIGGAA